MAYLKALKLFFIGTAITLCDSQNDPASYKNVVDLKSFPEGFIIGAASSSYQIEGAWNVDGKAENIWDHFTHFHPDKIADRSNGNVACDSYNKYKEDIAVLKKIGVDHYRFSLSWSRILPTGYTNVVNKAGVKYYHDVLDELEKNGIIPMVTIYHWDHPQRLERLGGWLNEEMALVYSEYARFVFNEYGNRVKIFATFNEPSLVCTMGYKELAFAPNVNITGGQYLCVQNMLKGNALAYHIYDEEFRARQRGKIGIVFPCTTPYSNDSADTSSADRAFEFECGWQAHPIFSKTGDYPEIMKKMVAKRSKLQGYYSSRLPTLSKYWIQHIRGTADFFGLNHYTSTVVTPLPRSSELSWPNDAGLAYSYDPSWPSTDLFWLKINPKGLADMLRLIKSKYNNPPVYIMENGVVDPNGTDDKLRINYHYSYMKEMLTAMKKDKCNVKAYTVWSLLDSFEWNSGYTVQFGLVDIDFKDPKLTRTPKKSVSWFKRTIAARRLQSPT
ncbi:myrosinase 1 [Nasonia vitripennis]|uniref:Uncharacterized protein n=1 Tax=Nasonia vitripennis TaxID=7425 RepID=A0A7M7HA80_NASVI|nr:myrosinase 1 [Nasonia vitripennis]